MATLFLLNSDGGRKTKDGDIFIFRCPSSVFRRNEL